MKKTVEVLRNSQRVKIWWELNKSSITLNITFEPQAERCYAIRLCRKSSVIGMTYDGMFDSGL